MERKQKQKKCRLCKVSFYPVKSTQTVCGLNCAIKLSKIQSDKKQSAEWKERKKILKNKIETAADLKQKLQKLVNQYVRLRDQGQPCISCQRSVKKVHAGHLYSVGKFPELRFDLDNINVQCEQCNLYLHGNGAFYLPNLVKKIGEERVNALKSRAGIPKNYLKSDLLELINEFKTRIKQAKEKKN